MRFTGMEMLFISHLTMETPPGRQSLPTGSHLLIEKSQEILRSTLTTKA